jgi:hypothetical protein
MLYKETELGSDSPLSCGRSFKSLVLMVEERQVRGRSSVTPKSTQSNYPVNISFCASSRAENIHGENPALFQSF